MIFLFFTDAAFFTDLRLLIGDRYFQLNIDY